MKKIPRFVKKSKKLIQVSKFQIDEENKSMLDNEEINKRIDNICKAMEGSIKNGKSEEEVIAEVLAMNSSYTLFLRPYIEEFKKRMAYPASRQYKTDGLTKDRVEIVIGAKNVNYMSDEKALKMILDNYRKRRERNEQELSR